MQFNRMHFPFLFVFFPHCGSGGIWSRLQVKADIFIMLSCTCNCSVRPNFLLFVLSKSELWEADADRSVVASACCQSAHIHGNREDTMGGRGKGFDGLFTISWDSAECAFYMFSICPHCRCVQCVPALQHKGRERFMPSALCYVYVTIRYSTYA